MATSSAGRQFGGVNYSPIDSKAPALIKTSMQLPPNTIKSEVCELKTISPENHKPKDDALVASAQKGSDSLTIQLGDALLDVFKTFTDRH
jgi:hypothetical protein